MIDINLRQKRDFGGVLNVAFAFVKQEYALFLKTILTFTVIPFLGIAFVLAYFLNQLINGQFQNLANSPDPETIVRIFTPIVILWVLFLTTYVLIIATTNGYLSAYDKKGRGNFTVADVGRLVSRKFFPIIGYGIIISIVAAAGFIFFFIPGVYLAVTLSLIFIIMFVEDKGLVSNFNRCFKIIKNNWWVTFGLIVVSSITVNILIQVFYLPIQIYFQFKFITIAESGDLSQFNITLVAITAFLVLVGMSILQSFIHMVKGIQYFNLVESDNTQSIIDRINQIGD